MVEQPQLKETTRGHFRLNPPADVQYFDCLESRTEVGEFMHSFASWDPE